jgi:hypothetical protein
LGTLSAADKKVSQQELLKLVVDRLDSLKIGYFVTGSWSSSLLGEPRSTHDLDLVVQLDQTHVPLLVESFIGERFYLSAAAITDAIQNRSMFNLLHLNSGDKVDFWLLTETAWDQERFRRREQADVFGTVIQVATAEDTILAKLRWSKLSGGSEKQMQDARGVFEVQSSRLNVPYIEHWVQELDVTKEWQTLNKKTSH